MAGTVTVSVFGLFTFILAVFSGWALFRHVRWTWGVCLIVFGILLAGTSVGIAAKAGLGIVGHAGATTANWVGPEKK
jgi:hypothetical protein